MMTRPRGTVRTAADKLVTQTWIVYMLLVIVTGAYAYTAASNSEHNARSDKQDAQRAADLQCIANYENASAARSAALLKLATPRNAALASAVAAEHDLWHAALAPHPVQAHIIALARALDVRTGAFEKADQAYNRALALHPLPSPVFNCSARLKSKTNAAGGVPTPQPSTLTYTAVSTSVIRGTTRTATATAVVTVPVPQPTTATVPGGTATVIQTTTRVVTVTRTVAPPDCVAHPMPPCTLRVPTLPRIP